MPRRVSHACQQSGTGHAATDSAISVAALAVITAVVAAAVDSAVPTPSARIASAFTQRGGIHCGLRFTNQWSAAGRGPGPPPLGRLPPIELAPIQAPFGRWQCQAVVFAAVAGGER
jgi:hypothetical protein